MTCLRWTASRTQSTGWATVASLLLALAVMLSLAAPAAAQEDNDAQDAGLSVEVVPDRDGTVRAGDEVTYRIEVVNEGEALETARIVQLLPGGFQHVEADPEGRAMNQEVSWVLPIGEGESLSLSHTVRAGTVNEVEGEQLIRVEQPDAPDGPGQFSSTVCVYAEQGAEATICGSAYQALAGDGMPFWVWIAVAVAVLLVVGAAVILWMRWRARSERV